MFRFVGLAVFLATISLGLVPASGRCGFVDSWWASKIENGPGYFEGQKRGYYTAGSVSARWPSTVDYPVTVEKPRLKVGCGGIDVFMGGFSFLDFDYLVDKLQNILASAPAASFDIALQALSPQAAQTIKDLEAIADRLNAIQLDDCKTAQAVVTIGKEALQGHEQGVTSALQTYLTESGLSGFYQATKEAISAADGVVSGANADIDAGMAGLAEHCPDDLKLLLQDNSVLEVIGVDKLGLDSSFVALIRGLVGDIQVRGAESGYLVSVGLPCPQNHGKRLDEVLEGTVHAMNAAGACAPIEDANADIRDFVGSQMTQIADRIRGAEAFAPSEEAFMDSSPLPLLHALRAAVATEQEGAVIASLTDLTAKAYALQLMADLYRRADIIVDTVGRVIRNQHGAKPGQPSYACQVYFATGKVAEEMQELRRRIQDNYTGLQRAYAAAAAELNAIYRVVEHLRRMDEYLFEETSARIGRSAASRAWVGQ